MNLICIFKHNDMIHYLYVYTYIYMIYLYIDIIHVCLNIWYIPRPLTPIASQASDMPSSLDVELCSEPALREPPGAVRGMCLWGQMKIIEDWTEPWRKIDW